MIPNKIFFFVWQENNRVQVCVPAPKYSPKKGGRNVNFDKNCFIPWLYCANEIALKREDASVMNGVRKVLRKLREGREDDEDGGYMNNETQSYIDIAGGQEAFDDIMQSLLVPV